MKNYYNGNIGTYANYYKTDNKKTYFYYEYDELDRLIYSYGKDQARGDNACYDESFTYDKMGNILSKQNRMTLDEQSLNYSYQGNRLIRIENESERSGRFRNQMFIDGTDYHTEYKYDSNGNLIFDENKGILRIEYNHLNLPTAIQMKNGNQIRFSYDAEGNKLSRTDITRTDIVNIPLGSIENIPSDKIRLQIERSYFGNIVYEQYSYPNRNIQEAPVIYRIMNDFGYFEDCSGGRGIDFGFVYYIKDHQGNVKTEINSNKSIKNKTSYFPSGLELDNSSFIEYAYNGKEKIESHGFNMYDYGARFYDQTISRWHSMDPLAEKYYSISPYAYCANNPVKYVDPDGMDLYRYDDETGTMILVEKTDDDFDQIGKFKYDKKTDSYTLRTNRKGEAKTRMDKIEKGILKDKLDLKNKDNSWDIGGEGNPTVKGFENFAIGFSEMIGKEVGGYYLSKSDNPNVVTEIFMGQHINNTRTEAKMPKSLQLQLKTTSGEYQTHTDWHTHPNYGYSKYDRTHGSKGDFESKEKAQEKLFPRQIPLYFIILTKGFPPIPY